MKIDWSKITTNQEVINLIKQRNALEDKIESIDKDVLIKYELYVLSQ